MTTDSNDILLALAVASKEINRGMLWIAGGLVVSLGAYLSADPGGSYFLFWGAPLYGLQKVWRGIKIKREINQILSQ